MAYVDGLVSYDTNCVAVLLKVRDMLSELPAQNPARIRMMYQLRRELENARWRDRAEATRSPSPAGFRNSLRAK